MCLSVCPPVFLFNIRLFFLLPLFCFFACLSTCMSFSQLLSFSLYVYLHLSISLSSCLCYCHLRLSSCLSVCHCLSPPLPSPMLASDFQLELCVFQESYLFPFLSFLVYVNFKCTKWLAVTKGLNNRCWR